MFYNDRLSGKEGKKRTAIIFCIIVVIIAWLVLVIRINTIFPRKKIEKCDIGRAHV